MATITLINPWSSATVHKDAADLVNHFDAYLDLIDDETIEAVNDKVTGNDKAEWLAAYVDHVGAEAAGIVILGS